MAYATPTDLEQLIPFKFTETSNPTEGQVQAIINRHTSRSDIILLARGIPEPVEGTNSYSFLRQLVLYLTAMDICRRKASESGQNSSPLADDYERMAKEYIDLIQNNAQALVER